LEFRRVLFRSVLGLKALDGASVAHLAAHEHHEPDNVLFSRLDFGQGPLNAYELLGLDQPPGHVVLSSCDLGRSTVAVGNETLGFTAALLHAGTRSEEHTSELQSRENLVCRLLL